MRLIEDAYLLTLYDRVRAEINGDEPDALRRLERGLRDALEQPGAWTA